MVSEPDKNYDVIRPSDGNGLFYLGCDRSATFAFDPVLRQTIIYLEDGAALKSGWTFQYEKAGDVCRLWVEESKVSVNFHEDK